MKGNDVSRVIVLGSSGMAGHVVTSVLRKDPSFIVCDISRRPFDRSTITMDLSDTKQLESIVKEFQPEIIVNCVGTLIKESARDPIEAIKINSLLPHQLVSLCDRHGGRLVHLSTDCVFSGRDGPYRETDRKDGDSIYDRTKALGEVVNERDLTIRTSITGPELKPNGTGLFDWFMRSTGPLNGYTESLWSGLMTTELVECIRSVCAGKIKAKGLVQVSVPDGISKFQLLKLFDLEFAKSTEIVPYLGERVDKRLVPTVGIDFHPADYATQVHNMRTWMEQNRSWYGHYEWRNNNG